MNTLNTFEKFVASLKPHHSYAQIVLETDKGDKGLEQANNILHTVGLAPLNTRIIRRESPTIVLILIPTDDMRTAALKLTEAGFTNVLGINSSPSDINLAYPEPEMNDEDGTQID